MVTLLWLTVTTDMVLGLIMLRSMTLSILYGNIDLLCDVNCANHFHLSRIEGSIDC